MSKSVPRLVLDKVKLVLISVVFTPMYLIDGMDVTILTTCLRPISILLPCTKKA